MKARIKRLRWPHARARAGAHDSSGMKFDATWHAHDLHQLLYAFEGSIEIEGGEARFLVPPQLAAFIPAGLTHRTVIQGRRSGSVFLPRAWIEPQAERIRIVRVSPLMREMIMQAMRWPINRPADPVGKSYFKTFALLCREWLEDEAALHLPTAQDPRLKRAMHYTQAHLAAAQFANVCKAAGLSERSMRRRFSELAGMSWMEFRHRSRLIRAMTLLESRHRLISNVAAEVGFESVSAFSKAFKEFTGESPRNYKQRVAR